MISLQAIIIDFINFSYHFITLTTFFCFSLFTFFPPTIQAVTNKQQCPSQRSERRSFYTFSMFSLVSYISDTFILHHPFTSAAEKEPDEISSFLAVLSAVVNEKVISYLMLKGFNLLLFTHAQI